MLKGVGMDTKKNVMTPPEGMIGPRVMHLQKLVRQVFNQAVSEEGLFSGQQDILFTISENEGITLGVLAKRLNVSVASASVSVKRMEKAGFIKKRCDKNDARIIRLYPTEKAKAAPENIKNKMDALESTLNKGMSEEEIKTFSDLLDRAIKNISERSEADD